MDGATVSIVVLLGMGLLHLIQLNCAVPSFVGLLEKRPALETTAYAIVAWVGVKLAVVALAHEGIVFLNHDFSYSTTWTRIFYGVLVAIALIWFGSDRKNKSAENNPEKEVSFNCI